jgi:UDP-glucuronate 4-epimerase
MKVLVTGAAGFIGMHVSKVLCSKGIEVIGLDNLNSYYDVELKYARLNELGVDRREIMDNVRIAGKNGFSFYKLDLTNASSIYELFGNEKFDQVLHLAAQAGVRYSVTNPREYINSNMVGFFNILEGVRHHQVKRLLYASSSSVYGLNIKVPFSIEDKTDSPASLYAATKKSNELMAHAYSHLFGIPTMGVRFFTVYGPWGRPDMALFKFTRNILEGRTIEIYNNGEMLRDFTYVDDVVGGLVQMVEKKWPETYCLQNIGRSEPVNLMDFVNEIEKCTGIIAKKEMKPLQQGDVTSTYADVTGLKEQFNYSPKVSIQEGVEQFVKWYRNYYK